MFSYEFCVIFKKTEHLGTTSLLYIHSENIRKTYGFVLFLSDKELEHLNCIYERDCKEVHILLSSRQLDVESE